MSVLATVIVPTVTPAQASALLGSLSPSGGRFETLVVDNGTASSELERAVVALDGAEVMRVKSNLGYGRAVNLAAQRAEGDVLVLLNDDCVVEEGFVDRIAGALDPGAGAVMAAGVMLDAADPALIDTAGMELDRTLLVFDYLNGEPVDALDRGVPDPVGPSGAAAAICRQAFLEAGGFDEALFAYWEDVDLVLRLRRMGGVCRLAADARGTHQHSATLGSGSERKDFLIGFGRGYVLRKWGVLAPRRLPAVLARELALSAGQAIVDRNLGGARGRLRGCAPPAARSPIRPRRCWGSHAPLASTLRRRWRRRARLRDRAE